MSPTAIKDKLEQLRLMDNNSAKAALDFINTLDSISFVQFSPRGVIAVSGIQRKQHRYREFREY